MSFVNVTNAMMAGAFAFAAIHHFYLWRLSRRSSLPLLVAVYCALSTGQTLAVFMLNTAADVPTAQRALDLRTSLALGALLSLTWLVSGLTRIRPRAFLYAISALFVTGIITNTLFQSIAGTVTGIEPVVLPWGEVTTAVVRQTGIAWFAILIYIGVVAVYLFATACGFIWSRGERTAGLLTASAGIAGLLAALLALAIDLGYVRSPYVGQFPNVLWMLLMTVLWSREHAAREQHLEASERALVVSEARYRALIDAAPEAIVVLDVAARSFADVNPEACRLFGAPADVLRKSNPIALSPPLQADGRTSEAAAADYLQQAMAGTTPVFEWIHRTMSGIDVPCEVRLVRIPDPERILIRGSITDISDRRRLEEQLRQSQKMEAIGQLAGGVAHDFNNLLTVISGYTEILHAQLTPDDPNANLVKAIGDATERAAWLTARLLAFGRRAVLTPQVFDLNMLVGDGERILRRLIGEHISLRLEAAPDPLHVKLDPGQWSQVMLNLAINARDAMADGGALVIRTFSHNADAGFAHAHPGLTPGRYAAFAVTDNGLGMPPEVRARIFEPFFTTKELGKGTGLGLAVVHGIVSQAGGSIDVETAPGAGTTFTVYLPQVAGPLSTSEYAQVRLGEQGAGETVLVVEDEAVLRELLDVALTAHGFKVTTAGDGAEALRALESAGPRLDLLVTDIVMPGPINGRELADAVRERVPGVKVLFISGYIDDPALRVAGFRPGEQCLQKPFSLAAIAQKARETLDAK